MRKLPRIIHNNDGFEFARAADAMDHNATRPPPCQLGRQILRNKPIWRVVAKSRLPTRYLLTLIPQFNLVISQLIYDFGNPPLRSLCYFGDEGLLACVYGRADVSDESYGLQFKEILMWKIVFFTGDFIWEDYLKSSWPNNGQVTFYFRHFGAVQSPEISQRVSNRNFLRQIITNTTGSPCWVVFIENARVWMLKDLRRRPRCFCSWTSSNSSRKCFEKS